MGAGTTIAPTPSRAATVAGEVGVSFLQAQLPAGTALPLASYEQLTRAVGLATSAHRRDAVSILTAALTRKIRGNSRSDETKLPCVWVARLLHASVAAAPEMASHLMELASSLSPDCADDLQTAAEMFNDKNVVDDKKVVDGKDRPAVAPPADPNSAATRDSAGLDGLLMDDPDVRNVGLFAGGYGPGFPGSPGFVGSAPGGNIALPRPIFSPVTPVMND